MIQAISTESSLIRLLVAIFVSWALAKLLRAKHEDAQFPFLRGRGTPYEAGAKLARAAMWASAVLALLSLVLNIIRFAKN